jgi:hypothetical protein
MDQQGIATQIMSIPWTFTGTKDDPGFAERFARAVNEEYAELIEKMVAVSPGTRCMTRAMTPRVCVRGAVRGRAAP